MFFISAQPDDLYFIWQQQVLTSNLKDLGVAKNQIKILIGYKESINPEWIKQEKTIHGEIYYYKDTRVSKNYLSSLRPNLLKQFYQEFYELANEYAFYHDADILFSKLPLFFGMEDGRIHLSSTVGYTGYKTYIQKKRVKKLEEDLREVIGIAEETLLKNEHNTGGAQYYFKNLGFEFWNEAEIKCEEFYNTYQNNKIQYSEIYKKENNTEEALDFQIWTTDMFVIQWLLWKKGKTCYANPELNFSWPNNSIKDWNNFKIFHNSGGHIEGFFNKIQYKTNYPYNDLLNTSLQPKTSLGETALQQIYIDYIKKVGKKILELEEGVSYIKVINTVNSLVNILTIFYSNKLVNKELILVNLTNGVFSLEQTNIKIVNSLEETEAMQNAVTMCKYSKKIVLT